MLTENAVPAPAELLGVNWNVVAALAAVGLPVIAPVTVFRLNPAGRAGLADMLNALGVFRHPDGVRAVATTFKGKDTLAGVKAQPLTDTGVVYDDDALLTGEDRVEHEHTSVTVKM